MNKTSYSYEEVDAAKGIIVLVHGFNLNPHKFQDFIHFFHQQGVSTLNVTMAGHDGSNEVYKASSQRWKEDVDQALDLAQNIALKKNIPLFFLGYSTGSLAASLLFIEKKYEVRKQFLFAPALAMRNYVSVGKLLAKVKVPKALIPEMNYKGYRATSYLPSVAYQAFFGLYKQWLDIKNKDLVDFPTFVFARKQDEIVSFSGLRNMINKNHFDKWEMHQLNKGNQFPMQHVMVDKLSLSPDWNFVTQKIQIQVNSSLSH